LPFISSKQSNDRSLLARGGNALFLGLIAALSFGLMGGFVSKDAHAQNTTVSTAQTGSQACCTPTVIPNSNSTLTITSSGSITNTNTGGKAFLQEPITLEILGLLSIIVEQLLDIMGLYQMAIKPLSIT
jgi:hypothetical protein